MANTYFNPLCMLITNQLTADEINNEGVLVIYEKDDKNPESVGVFGIYSENDDCLAKVERSMDSNDKISKARPYFAGEKYDSMVICIPDSTDDDGKQAAVMMKRVVGAVGDKSVSSWNYDKSIFYDFKKYPFATEFVPDLMGMCKMIRWKTRCPISYGFKKAEKTSSPKKFSTPKKNKDKVSKGWTFNG